MNGVNVTSCGRTVTSGDRPTLSKLLQGIGRELAAPDSQLSLDEMFALPVAGLYHCAADRSGSVHLRLCAYRQRRSRQAVTSEELLVARQTIVTLVDDLDGSEAKETVTFGLDGVEYTIDLSSDNAAKLRQKLSQFVDHARRAGGRKQRRPDAASKTTTGDREKNQAIRDWARSQGHQVSERGRIPQDLIVAFKEAQPA